MIEDDGSGDDIEGGTDGDTGGYTGLPAVEREDGESNVDILIKAKTNAEANPDQALMECAKIDIVSIKEDCIHDVAKISKKSGFCDKVTTQDVRDMCYMYFVNNFQEFTLCDKIIDKNTKLTCDSFKNFRDVQAQYYVLSHQFPLPYQKQQYHPMRPIRQISYA